jgi:hypothetical protein
VDQQPTGLGPGDLDLARHRRLPGGAFEDRLQLGVADQLQRRPPLGVGGQLQGGAQGRVDQQHPALAIEHQHPLLHRLQMRPSRSRSAAQRGQGRRQAPRHRVEGAGQLGDLVGADRAAPARRGRPAAIRRATSVIRRSAPGEHLRGRAGGDHRDESAIPSAAQRMWRRRSDRGGDLAERHRQPRRPRGCRRQSVSGTAAYISRW